MENDSEQFTLKDKLINSASSHPYVLMGIIVVLVVVIIVMYMSSGRGNNILKSLTKKQCTDSDEEEVDILIKSIYEKQRIRKQT